MTTERIDHGAEARLCGERAEHATNDMEALTQLVSAQAHATLALVEQQRIANLLAISHWTSTEHLGYKLDALRRGVAGEVWEGLGL